MRRRAERSAVLAARAAGRAASRDAADAVLYGVSGPEIARLRRGGMTFQDIADHLNDTGIRPPAGGDWWPGGVRKVWLRFSERIPE
ncbi:hypothetical protein [Deinococcus metallilatus]|uniref:Recombinase domain-containing protein n=1 Tax=Deinococcus metallilatus TaxID=1211322 RepID=A0AAJ5F1J3_9DEIO|nr:hypothetical protein [Deinococcus metallilatus]MBB5297481.1 hypothetical protein [Deinococcus metallilatus]RXJ08048.1 hypothetical protein ERJ73_19550 [Deinococcus metallilatus]TLK20530.1 hypothetical protein FCS05_20095 [Deinococcus metallilatus]